MNAEIVQRIEMRLKALGLSANAACLKAGISKDAIRNWQRSPELMPSTRSLIALAPILETTVNWLLGETDEMAPSPDIGIRYGGIVEAGAFRPIDGLNQDAELRRIDLAPDPRFPVAAQAAFEVVGDSMNLTPILPGMWVLAIDVFAYERLYGEPGDGRLVIVARTRAGDSERELTVKRLRIFRDRLELRPESSNPRHEPLIFPNPPRDGDVHGQIIAVVLQATWRFA